MVNVEDPANLESSAESADSINELSDRDYQKMSEHKQLLGDSDKKHFGEVKRLIKNQEIR